MKKYTLKSLDGTVIEVRATNEDDARSYAMAKRWGPTPQSIGSPPVTIHSWHGQGLSLENVKSNT